MFNLAAVALGVWDYYPNKIANCSTQDFEHVLQTFAQ